MNQESKLKIKIDLYIVTCQVADQLQTKDNKQIMLPSYYCSLLLLFLLKSVSSWCLHKSTTGIVNITQIQYSPDRSQFLATTSAGKVEIWDAPNMIMQTRLTPASGTATDARFSKNNTVFCVGTTTSMIYVYNSTSPYTLLSTITGGIGTGSVQIDTSTDGNYLLICGGNTNTVKVYSFLTSSFTTSISFSGAQTCKFAPDNKFVVSATTSSTVNYYNLDGTQVWTQSYNGCLDLDIQDTSTTLVMSCNNGANRKAWIIDIATQTGNNIYTSTAILRTAQISPDGSYMAYSGDQKKLFIVSASGGTYSLDYSFPLLSQAYSSDFSSDSNYLLVATKTGQIYQYSKFCIDCSSGEYQNLTTKKCELCSQFNRACGSCINSTYCYECVQGYYIQPITVAFTTTRICLPCLLEGCIVCHNSTSCIRCEVGYYVTGGICKSCRTNMPGCLRCTESSTCQQCTHDYYLNGGNTCTICTTITGCSLCSTSSYCHVCQIGYYFSGGNCQACPTNCLACYNTTTCQDCRLGYYPTNTAAATCSQCPTTGCLSCNQTGYCMQCTKNRYYDSTAGTCPACTFPCNECYNSTLCVDCVPGYFLDFAAFGFSGATSGGACTRCSHPCQTCNTTSYCLSCPVGYYLVSANNTCVTCDLLQAYCSQCSSTTCLNCTLGYYLNSSNLCTSCTTNINGCISCTSISACLKCAPGLYLNGAGTACDSCPEGCQVCYSGAYCLGCIDGFYLDRGLTQVCKRCVPPCSICTSSSACLQCEEHYYLNGTSCSGCRQNITNCIACDDQTGVIKCTSCRVGYFVDTTGGCTPCTLPCLVCSSGTVCSQCQIGYFVSGTNSCSLCAYNCTSCSSLTSCSSCSIGFYLSQVESKCYPCPNISCLTCNSTQHCLSCSVGYYLTTSQTCDLCINSIKYCQTCESAAVCLSCSFGYTLSSGNTSCVVCSTIVGCFDCSTTTSCDVCQNGYFWVNNSGIGACEVCDYGCLTCLNATYCQSCLPGYTFSNNTCVLCQDMLLGCSLCTNNATCVQCQNGYYLSTNTCSLCRSAIKGCSYCNSSSICTNCAYGYHIKTDNTCQICSITLQGCEVCISSTVCRVCSNGYYLAGSTCTLCVSAMPGCLSCTDNSTCLECIEGYAIQTSSLQCRLCKNSMIGCIACTNLSICSQCEAGYYLRSTDNQCVACSQKGCEVCPQSSPTLCISCNTMYFMSSSRCYYCRDYMEGCIQCTSSSTCTLCETGYFVNSTNKCQLCQNSLQGCSKCNSSASCYECKSTYYLESTSTCRTCLSAMDGCAYCLDLTSCISCSNGYYKNQSTGFCQLCTQMEGCLACEDWGVCLVCRGEYFLDQNDTICYPCAAIPGCYSCVDNITCVVCSGGYILNDDKLCQIYAVQADQPIQGMKMITEYVDKQTLSHSLMVHQLTYVQKQFSLMQWQNTTDITLQYPTFVLLNLTIKEVKFETSNILKFYTNNPLDIELGNIVARRMLRSMPDGYKTYLKMKQEMINTILPDLYISHSLVMDYDLNQPEFYTSFYSTQFNLYHSAFGIVFLLILIINYIVRAVVTCPGQPISQHAQIFSHFLAFKAPIFIVYPLFPEEISFCFGFMAPELPWARQFFSSALSDRAQVSPEQYSVLYHSMSFGSTYMLPLIVLVGLLIAMWLYKKNGQKKRHEKKNIKDISYEIQQGTKFAQQINWGLPEWPLKMVLYNFFYFGLVFNGCASLQNSIYNPIMQVNVTSAFTVIGIVCYALALTDCLYSLYSNPLLFFKLRLFTKASLLSLCHISPIYLFSSALALDFLCLIIEYRITKEQKSHEKLWLYNNIMLDICLGLLIYIHSHFVMLIFVGIISLSVLGIQFYVHYQDYHFDKNKKRFILPQQYKGSDNENDIGEGLNIWNINFDKQQAKQPDPSSNIKQLEQPMKFTDSRAFKHEKRSKKRKAKQNSKGLNLKEQSMQNIESFENERGKDEPNTFIAADFIN